MKYVKEKLKGRKGQAFAEFAMMLPLMLFLIIVGLILALAINSKLTISNASHEAARVAAVTTDEDKIRAIAENGVINGGLMYQYESMTTFDPENDITINRHSDGTVSVTIQYKQPTIVPLIGGLLGNPDFWGTSIQLESSARFLDETKLVPEGTG
ncbi:TadE/TadG family type IV pilus assembly protein [Lentibacillus salinarum]|uniref:TadE/TadG family type IV pilus assembly protein n=1 Tax=Lentibacillus salinarum TaxID=446820 RepID=A0ABW3ZX31_9BACI